MMRYIDVSFYGDIIPSSKSYIMFGGIRLEANKNYVFQNEGPRCYGCYGRDVNRAEDPSYDDHYSNDCPLMWDLARRGCIHKMGRDWCRGLPNPRQSSVPLIFRRDQRWFDQARAHVQGGEFDYNVDAKAGNLERVAQETRLAAQERAKATGGQGMPEEQRSIMRRDGSSPALAHLPDCAPGLSFPPLLRFHHQP